MVHLDSTFSEFQKPKRPRGRPAKQFNSIEDAEDEAIIKWLNKEPLTLEETGLLLWMMEGRKTPKPYTKVQVLNIERKALQKVKDSLAKQGISDMEDIKDVLRAR